MSLPRRHTRLWRLRVSLPAKARIAVSCVGRGCPRLQQLSAGRRGLKRLLLALRGRVYRAGDRVYLVITAPGYQPERAECLIRNGQMPAVWLL